MSEQRRKVVPAQLGFLAIYNPSLGSTDDTLDNQIVYYYPSIKHNGHKRKGFPDTQEARAFAKEQKNEQLRQIGLAQGMVEFGKSFSEGKSVDTVETEKSRIILHELESGWWILAVSNFILGSIDCANVHSQSTSRYYQAQRRYQLLKANLPKNKKPSNILLEKLNPRYCYLEIFYEDTRLSSFIMPLR